MSYTVQEVIGIVDDLGLTDALKEISPESIEDAALKELWKDAQQAVDKLDEFLDIAVESDDNLFEDDDIDWGSDNDDDDEEENGFLY